MLDLHAPIDPGQSAAGFKIGQSLSSVEPFLKDTRPVNDVPGFHLNIALAQNKGALILRSLDQRGGVTIFFGSDAVRLVFSAYGQLACIYVFDGYMGSYRGLRVGDMLSMISKNEPIEFDDGDEMYYRLDSERQYVPGLAVVAVDAPASEHASTPVAGFCVHDWTLFRVRSE
ncbi:hypothetical protein BO996_19725 [Delftia sp. HK171]|uniref:hypothetical protein n=1 Tax=Delftia sp. HK171 TaxID=1920191 RepID=UPI00090330F7|nr:hypothetical protein [Delftia sp. HK171]APE49896.1 hypothetical protein BO996_19725 [Delftia sp. HK171]